MMKPKSSFWDDNAYTPWTLQWIGKELLVSCRTKTAETFACQKKFVPTGITRSKSKNALSKKCKVGFGPVVEGECNIGVRVPRIDPIVNLHQQGERYSANIF